MGMPTYGNCPASLKYKADFLCIRAANAQISRTRAYTDLSFGCSRHNQYMTSSINPVFRKYSKAGWVELCSSRDEACIAQTYCVPISLSIMQILVLKSFLMACTADTALVVSVISIFFMINRPVHHIQRCPNETLGGCLREGDPTFCRLRRCLGHGDGYRETHKSPSACCRYRGPGCLFVWRRWDLLLTANTRRSISV